MSDQERPAGPSGECDPPARGHCSVCGDEAWPALVMALDGAAGIAEIEVQGERRKVSLDLVEGVVPGDTLLIHQGFAIARILRP